MASFDIGDLVTFNYTKGTQVTDQFPTVLVLHDNWLCHTPRGTSGLKVLPQTTPTNARCMHGLNWNNLDGRDKRWLRGVMNPALEAKLSKEDDDFAQRIELVNNMPNLDIQSPEDFYQRLIRPFIKPRGWEPYRRYRLDKILGVRVVESKELLAGTQKDTLWQRSQRRLRALRGRRFWH